MLPVDVESGTAFNTPTTGTPILKTTLSSKTLILLEDLSDRLKVRKDHSTFTGVFHSSLDGE